MADYDPADRAQEAYELAYERVAYARQEWAKAGQPLTVLLYNSAEVVHPLLKALQSCESETARRLAEARIKHRGPAPTAVVQRSIGDSPAQKLRALR